MPYLEKDLARKIRQEIRARFSDFKISVRRVDGHALYVTIISGPLDLLKGVNSGYGYESVNHFYVKEHYEDFPKKKDFLLNVLEVMERERDRCVYVDGDYGSIPSYYINLNIGSYDKPYEFKPAA